MTYNFVSGTSDTFKLTIKQHPTYTIILLYLFMAVDIFYLHSTLNHQVRTHFGRNRVNTLLRHMFRNIFTTLLTKFI